MDDLKRYDKNDYEMDGLIITVKIFSDGIAVEFGLDKYINESFKIVKLMFTSSVLLDINVINQLEHEDVYKYLGFYKSQVIKTVSMKDEIRI